MLFMGYGRIGIYALDTLISCGAEIVGVVPRASDRHIRHDTPSLYTRASELGLHIFPYTSPHDPSFLEEAAVLQLDYVISVQYDRILKDALIAIPEKGVLNLHFAPLPRLRGCFPTKWAIINNESSGVTLHYIDPGIDTGPIIAQKVVNLEPSETDATLYAKLVEAGELIMDEYTDAIVACNLPEAVVQDDARSSYYPKDIPHGGVIDWNKGAVWVERFIRAFTFEPYPAAKTFLGAHEIQIRYPITIEKGAPGIPAGHFVFESDETLKVSCGDDSIIVHTVLLNGEEKPVCMLKDVISGSPVFAERPS